MRHRKEGKKFHRVASRRRSFLRNLGNDLVRAGHITTTETRAKAVRPLVERWITLAKKQTLSHRRILYARTGRKDIVTKLFGDIASRYEGRSGGYLRVVKLGKSRKRDGGRLATVEFV